MEKDQQERLAAILAEIGENYVPVYDRRMPTTQEALDEQTVLEDLNANREAQGIEPLAEIPDYYRQLLSGGVMAGYAEEVRKKKEGR